MCCTSDSPTWPDSNQFPDSPIKSDLDQFCEDFGKLVKDKVKKIEYCGFGVVAITFKDGTECGSMVPWFRSGLIDKDAFVERYHTTK